jgi:hypothetical protein
MLVAADGNAPARIIVICRLLRLNKILLRLGGQALHENLTSVSLAIVLTAGAVYHFAVLVAALSALPA